MPKNRPTWHSMATYERDEIICKYIKKFSPCNQNKLRKKLELNPNITKRELDRMIEEGKIKVTDFGNMYIYRVVQ